MITTNSSGSTIPTMRYDETLHRVRAEGFRVGAWQDRLGSTIFAPGRPALAGGELDWAIMYGYLAAWPAALFTAAITCLGGYLLYASWRGRIRTLGLHIGRNR